jgi:hypothetical protein
MLIKLPDTPVVAADKPQVHSQANHDTYDGTLHMPLRTRTLVYTNLSFPALQSVNNHWERDCVPRLPRHNPVTSIMTDTAG